MLGPLDLPYQLNHEFCFALSFGARLLMCSLTMMDSNMPSSYLTLPTAGVLGMHNYHFRLGFFLSTRRDLCQWSKQADL